MAIYHASFKIISRSNGSSSVASAAYRSGERLTNTTTGEIHHYVAKQEHSVADAFILAPESAPGWITDRSLLWSAVEDVERRKDAQLARELNVALPVELPVAEQTRLIRDYVQSQFVDRGMVADVALHDLDSHNPHAHVMLTMRDIDAQGFGKKNRAWNDRALVSQWREQWSRYANRALEEYGVEARIDHRSLEEQGVDRVPTIHLGYKAHAMEQRGIKTERGDINRLIASINESISNLGSQIKAWSGHLKILMSEVTDKAVDKVVDGVQALRSSVLEGGERPDTTAGKRLIDQLKSEKAERDQLREQDKARQRRLEREKLQDLDNDLDYDLEF